MSLTTVFVIGVIYYYRGQILYGIKVAVVGGIILLPVSYVLGFIILEVEAAADAIARDPAEMIPVYAITLGFLCWCLWRDMKP